MKNPFCRLSFIASSLAVAAMLCLPASTRALTYTIDPNASTLTLSGSVLGLSFLGQSGASSMSTHWSGTIVGNLDFTGTTLTLSGGSAITASLNPTAPFVPKVYPFPLTPVPYGPGGLSPSTPYGINNYGLQSSGLVSGFGFCTVTGSYQGLVLDLPSGTAQNGLASTVNLKFTAGAIESIGTAAGGTIPLGDISSLVGNNANNTSSSAVLLSTVSGISILALPVQFVTTGGNNRTELWVGQIVATAVIPEPSSIALALVGMGLLAARARARRS